MQQRGEGYWRKEIEKQTTSGMSITGYCRKRKLPCSTFLRWRKRLSEDGQGQSELVEISNRSAFVPHSDDIPVEVRIGCDIRIIVHAETDLELVGSLIAAIRGAS
jgi:hypothetical protein